MNGGFLHFSLKFSDLSYGEKERTLLENGDKTDSKQVHKSDAVNWPTKESFFKIFPAGRGHTVYGCLA